jgi:uncharacterized membrane protein
MTETPQTPTTQTKPPEPKVLFYILSFLIGLFGIIFGIIYMTKEGEENKKFGKLCLILGLLPMIIACICWLILFVFGLGASFIPGTTETSSFNTSFNTY